MNGMSDEELLKQALLTSEDDETEYFDVKYYQEKHLLVRGQFRIHVNILYSHYKEWSVDPISISNFYDILNIRKYGRYIFLNKLMCTIDITRLIGNYVRRKKSKEKKARLRQISSIKPKVECED
jgi:hypothetical protein